MQRALRFRPMVHGLIRSEGPGTGHGLWIVGCGGLMRAHSTPRISAPGGYHNGSPAAPAEVQETNADLLTPVRRLMLNKQFGASIVDLIT